MNGRGSDSNSEPFADILSLTQTRTPQSKALPQSFWRKKYAKRSQHRRSLKPKILLANQFLDLDLIQTSKKNPDTSNLPTSFSPFLLILIALLNIYWCELFYIFNCFFVIDIYRRNIFFFKLEVPKLTIKQIYKLLAQQAPAVILITMHFIYLLQFFFFFCLLNWMEYFLGFAHY